MKKTLGLALILSGASGTGKSTVLNALRQRMPDLLFSVSCTTRAPRANEQEGRDYYFMKRADFDFLLREEAFIEHAEVHGNAYGTLKNQILDPVHAGKIVLLDIDVQGAAQIRQAAEKDPFLRACTTFVFLAPPSFAELERRLRGRQSDAEEVIERRLRNAHGELEHWRDYDYVFVNHDFEAVAEQLYNLIKSQCARTSAYTEAPFEN